MTDKQIINQWKRERELAECVCSCFVDQVELSLVNETIDLINRQKAEIERLKECPKCVYEYRGEMTEYCIQGPCSNFKTVEKIKSEAIKEFTARLKGSVIVNNIMESQKIKREAKTEAIKEFANRLKEASSKLTKCNNGIPISTDYQISSEELERILKEMVGENK